jgi:hypothetical protein
MNSPPAAFKARPPGTAGRDPQAVSNEAFRTAGPVKRLYGIDRPYQLPRIFGKSTWPTAPHNAT